MLVDIEARRDYGVHINNLVSTNMTTIAPPTRLLFKRLAMQCFDDGNTFNQGNLKVKVDG